MTEEDRGRLALLPTCHYLFFKLGFTPSVSSLMRSLEIILPSASHYVTTGACPHAATLARRNNAAVDLVRRFFYRSSSTTQLYSLEYYFSRAQLLPCRRVKPQYALAPNY